MFKLVRLQALPTPVDNVTHLVRSVVLQGVPRGGKEQSVVSAAGLIVCTRYTMNVDTIATDNHFVRT